MAINQNCENDCCLSGGASAMDALLYDGHLLWYAPCINYEQCRFGVKLKMNTNLFKQVFDIFETCADVKNGSEEYHSSVIAFDYATKIELSTGWYVRTRYCMTQTDGDVRLLTDARTDERSERGSLSVSIFRLLFVNWLQTLNNKRKETCIMIVANLSAWPDARQPTVQV